MADESHDPRDLIESDPEEAVDFGTLSEALDHHDYPTTNEELLDVIGDHEVAFQGGRESLAERESLADVLSAHQGVIYGSADEVREAVANVVTAEPVGEGYGHRSEHP